MTLYKYWGFRGFCPYQDWKRIAISVYCSFFLKEILFTAFKKISVGRRTVATIRMFGGFLDGETDNKKEYGKAEQDFPTFGV